MYTPYDFNEAVAHRKEYIEERLREGSPVVGLAFQGGLLMLTVRREQRKIYEIYDRQMFSAIGYQSDIEGLRLGAIQMAHQEGFERSPDDVSLHRLIGFGLSPSLKKAFGDPRTMPFVFRGLFAEIGLSPAGDHFVTLDFDGEYRWHTGAACIAGVQIAEDRMLERIDDPGARRTRDEALRQAIVAWCVGAREALKPRRSGDESLNPFRDVDEADADRVFLRDELKTGTLEAAVLERPGNRFRLLTEADLQPILRDYLS